MHRMRQIQLKRQTQCNKYYQHQSNITQKSFHRLLKLKVNKLRVSPSKKYTQKEEDSK